MICPKCGAQCPEDARTCPACQIELTTQKDLNNDEVEIELETIYRGTDKAELIVIESVLQEADIRYIIAYKEMEGIFGWGNSIAGPLEIKVKKEDAEEALALLEAFRSQELDENFYVAESDENEVEE